MNDLVALFNLVSLTVVHDILDDLAGAVHIGHGGGKAGIAEMAPRGDVPRIGNQLQREAGNILGDGRQRLGIALDVGIERRNELDLAVIFRPLDLRDARIEVAVVDGPGRGRGTSPCGRSAATWCP